MKNIKINYKVITDLVKNLVTEQQENYITLPAKKVKEYLSFVSFKGDQLRRFPEIRGKKIIVDGTLELKDTDIDTLGPIAKVINGSINAGNTPLRSWGDYEGEKYKVYFYNTPLQQIERKKIIKTRNEEQDVLRVNGEWELEKDTDLGNKANALLTFLYDEDYYVLKGDKLKQKQELEEKLKSLNDRYEETEDRAEIENLIDEISNVEEELQEFENSIDLYDLVVTGEHYNLTMFEINNLEYWGEQFGVGDYDEMESSVIEYAKSFVDDNGAESFSEWLLEDSLDIDQLLYTLDFDTDVRENLDSYFDDSDKELSMEQKQKIVELKTKIKELNDRQENLDLDDEDYSDNYDEISDEISELEDEIDDIESSPDGDIPEDKIQELIDSKEDDVRNDPKDAIEMFGLSLKDFIDEEKLAESWVQSDGWGIISSYDGEYAEETVNEKSYYIIIINK